MDPKSTKYPSTWYQGRQRDYQQKEQARLNTIDAIKKEAEVSTREKVLPYSWATIVLRLEQIYSEVLRDAVSER